jgi:DNA mismatch repair ATPase MutS
LFDNTRTIGGREKLEKIFKSPLDDQATIKKRIGTISYFHNNNLTINIDKQTCDFVEFYLKQHYQRKSFIKIIGFFERIIYAFNSNNNYYVIQQGVENTLKVLLEFIASDFDERAGSLNDLKAAILKAFDDEDFIFVKQLVGKKEIGAIDLARADAIFRHSAVDKIKNLLDIIYQLDVYVSVSTTAKIKGFALPVIKPNDTPSVVIKGLFHPFLTDPVCNDVDFSYHKNLFFITGTNMAGKSTFLKAIGVCVYLSQLGFPVPAAYMETTTFNGLLTTINIEDNIDQGHSHFYSEVLRVKQVAEKVSQSKNVFVIFDELFRGTNVKDAYDASLAIITAFSKVRKCFFLVSTHIVEVANELKSIDHIDFKYMETLFDNGIPTYSYKLKNGITEERLGWWIVKNEKIVEIIERSINPQ